MSFFEFYMVANDFRQTC